MNREVTCDSDREIILFADYTLKRQQMSSIIGSEQYIDTKYILLTSNICDRLFSVAGHALGSRRKSMLLANSESPLFLSLNGDLWDGMRET